MDNVSLIKFVSPIEMANMLGVKTRQVTRWAREGRIPKLSLPSGRFVFDPEVVVKTLREQSQSRERIADAR
jgi:predicted site-specific integrase-resolvase